MKMGPCSTEPPNSAPHVIGGSCGYATNAESKMMIGMGKLELLLEDPLGGLV